MLGTPCLLEIRQKPRIGEGSEYCLVRLDSKLAFPNEQSCVALCPHVLTDNVASLVLLYIVLYIHVKPHCNFPASQQLVPTDIFTSQMSKLVTGYISAYGDWYLNPCLLESVGEAGLLIQWALHHRNSRIHSFQKHLLRFYWALGAAPKQGGGGRESRE